MPQKTKPNFILLFLVFLPIFFFAQKSYRIEKLSDEDGFPNSAPLGVGFQDTQGMIWFSEPGSLLRYDGYEAIKYPYQHEKKIFLQKLTAYYLIARVFLNSKMSLTN